MSVGVFSQSLMAVGGGSPLLGLWEVLSYGWLWAGAAYCGWSHPTAGGVGLYKEDSQESQEKQAGEHHSSMASASVPAFRFLL